MDSSIQRPAVHARVPVQLVKLIGVSRSRRIGRQAGKDVHGRAVVGDVALDIRKILVPDLDHVRRRDLQGVHGFLPVPDQKTHGGSPNADHGQGGFHFELLGVLLGDLARDDPKRALAHLEKQPLALLVEDIAVQGDPAGRPHGQDRVVQKQNLNAAVWPADDGLCGVDRTGEFQGAQPLGRLRLHLALHGDDAADFQRRGPD